MQPYSVRDSMLDPVERSLYRALHSMLCQRALLFTKINLSDLFAMPYQQSAPETSLLTNQKVDFVLCDRDSVRPLAIILFEEDEVVTGPPLQSEQISQICAQAGLPVVRLQRQPTYYMHQLTPLIEPLLVHTPQGEEYSTEEWTFEENSSALRATLGNRSRLRGKQPAYPGYGALRTIANKLS